MKKLISNLSKLTAVLVMLWAISSSVWAEHCGDRNHKEDFCTNVTYANFTDPETKCNNTFMCKIGTFCRSHVKCKWIDGACHQTVSKCKLD